MFRSHKQLSKKCYSPSLRRHALAATVMAISQLSTAPTAFAGPQGERIVGGAGSIKHSGNTTTINQSSQRMAIDWDSYNVGKDEIVSYVQPSADAISLNRILSHHGSEIHGRINANGQVVLVNPHGIVFGKNARIDAGGIIASGLNINPDNFMNGNLTFSAMEGDEGTVLNQGIINAATGGSVSLLGKQVHNEGMISAHLGAVNLAAGKEAVITFDSSGLMGVRVSEAILQDELGIEPGVLNSGDLTAQGGRILLTASTSRDIFSQAVNTGDLEQATSVVMNKDGSFTLGTGSDVVNAGSLTISSDVGTGEVVMLGENVTSSGTIQADFEERGGHIELHAKDTALLTENSLTSARGEEGLGGTVKVLGYHVGLFDDSNLDVSGAFGGGNALIGGDYKGQNLAIPNAWRTYVSPDSRIRANALTKGDGGRVIVWADDITRFWGDIEGRGLGGNGGFAEVSGKNQLLFQGYADLSGSGAGGTLLLDPRDIVINEIGDNQLNEDVNFEDHAGEDLVISNAAIRKQLNDGTNVLLEATRNITSRAEIVTNGSNTNSLELSAGDDIRFTENARIDLGAGDITLTAGHSGCGDDCPQNLPDGHNISINSTLQTQGGNITLEAPGAIKVSADLITGGGSLLVGTDEISVGSFDSSGATLNTTSETHGGNITIYSKGGVTLGDATFGGVSENDIADLGTLFVESSSGNISVVGEYTYNSKKTESQGSLTLNALEGGITLSDVIVDNGKNNDPKGALNVTLSANDSIALESDSNNRIWLDGGNFEATSTDGTISLANVLNTEGGNVTLDGDVELTDDINLNTSGGSFHVTGNVDSDSDAEGGELHDFELHANHVVVNGNIGSGNGLHNLTIDAGDNNTGGFIQLNGDISVTGEAELELTGDHAGKIELNHDEILSSDVALHGNDVWGHAFVAPNAKGTWTSSGSRHGNLVQKQDDVERTISFDNFTHLQGSNKGDEFELDHDFGSVTGGTGNDTFILSESDNLQQLDGVSGNNELVVGSSSGEDVFWIIGSEGSNTVDDLSFNKIDNLKGGNGDDNFTFQPGASLAGDIDGGSESGNSLSVSGSNTWSLNGVASGKVSDLTFSRIQDLEASGEGINTLIATDSDNSWELESTGKGNLSFGDAELQFSGMDQLTGGDGKDIFEINTDEVLEFALDGGSGEDQLLAGERNNIWSLGETLTLNDDLQLENIETLVGNTRNDDFIIENSDLGLTLKGGRDGTSHIGNNSLTIASETDKVQWDITSDNAGHVDGWVADFTDIQNLIGGAGNDHFELAAGASLDSVRGLPDDSESSGETIDQLTILSASDATTEWGITDQNSGHVTDRIDNFYDIASLVGGEGEDEFTLSGDGAVATIDGAGADNSLYLQTSNRTFTFGNGLSGDEIEVDINFFKLKNLVAHTDATHTLVGANQNNEWVIDEANKGTLNGELNFEGIAHLRGNGGKDTFKLQDNGSISGTLDGGSDEGNTLNLTAANDKSLKVALQARSADTDIDLVLSRIQDIIGESSDDDSAEHTLFGAHQDNEWIIDGTDSGTVGGVTFKGMANLVGGNADDTFVLDSSGEVTGLIDGSGHDTRNTMDYSKVSVVDLTWGDTNDFDNIQHLVGNGDNSTLRGGDKDHTWELNDGENRGSLDGMTFTGMTHLVGGDKTDTFDLNGGWVTGRIVGGTGATTINLTLAGGINGQLNVEGGDSDNNQIYIAGSDGKSVRYSIDTGGAETLTFTGTNNASYQLSYQGFAGVQDTWSADRLILEGSLDADRMTLSDGGFAIDGYTSYTFDDKHNLTIAASHQDQLDLSGEIELAGNVEIRNAAVRQSGNGHLQANTLRLVNPASFGTQAQPILTDVTDLYADLGDADVYLRDLGNLNIAALDSSGNLEWRAAGEISSGQALTASGPASFISDGGSLDLSHNNRFTGPLSLSAAGDIRFSNRRNTLFQTLSATGLSFDIQGDLNAKGPVEVEGLTRVSASGSVHFEHNENRLNRLDVREADQLVVHNRSALELANLNAREVNLKTQGLHINGAVTADQFVFDAGQGAATVDRQVTVNDRLEGQGEEIIVNADLEANSLSLASANDLFLNAETLSNGNQSLTANGDLVMRGSAESRTREGEMALRAGRNLSVTHLDVGKGQLSVTAENGSIDNSGAGGKPSFVAGRLELKAGSGIGANDPLTSEVEVLNAQSQSGRLELNNRGELHIERLASNDTIRLTNTGRVILDNRNGPVFSLEHTDALTSGGTANANYNLGSLAITVDQGDLLALGTADATNPDVVARDASLLVNGGIGSVSRPLVIYVKDSLFIQGLTSWPSTWGFDQRPGEIVDNSSIQLDTMGILQAGAEQMVELETLADLPPGIFTDVRNYTYADIAIRLPPDQIYDEDYY